MNQADRDEVGRIVQVLLASERVARADLNNMILGCSAPWRIIHAAFEIVRVEHGIVFAPARAFPGYMVRADPGQIVARAARFRRAGHRRTRRGVEMLHLGAELTKDEKEKERLERLAARAEEKEALKR